MLPSLPIYVCVCVCIFVGGALHAALKNSHLMIDQVEFTNNTAQSFGGAVYIGQDHEDVLFGNVSIRQSSADSGGGIYLSRFCKDIAVVDSVIVENTALSGGGLSSSADSLTIQGSVIENNTATLVSGGILMENAIQYVVIDNSSISWNVAGASTGGISLSDCANVIIKGCQFLGNDAQAGSGGALAITACTEVFVNNTSFSHNTASDIGGGGFVGFDSSKVSFLRSQWEGNRAGDSGGALYFADSLQVEVNISAFRANKATSGSGSALYVRGCDFSLSQNEFNDNMASGGGTVYWEHDSGMDEPNGLQSSDNTFQDSNVASYGSKWATEAHHTRLKNAGEVFAVVDFDNVAPEVEVILQDFYDQVLVTDSTTLAIVSVAASSGPCYLAPGIVTGTTTETFFNGSTTFDFLQPLCAPNYTLGLTVTTSSNSVSGDTTFEYAFRACVRGEYYGEFICNPCEDGTFSFMDPVGRALSELSKSDVCVPCPSQASTCYKDTIVLNSGYWRSDNESVNILECPWHAESCRGGRHSGDASCGKGYLGPLCAVCEDNYHFVSTSRTCESCDQTASFFDPFTVVLIVFVFGCICVTGFVVKNITKNEHVESIDGFLALMLLRLRVYSQETYNEEVACTFQRTHNLTARAFKSFVVYVTFYQIVSTLPFILDDVDFPKVYDIIVSAFSIVNLSVNQESIVRCSTSAQYDYVTKLVVGTAVPLVVSLIIGVVGFIHLRCFRGADSSNVSHDSSRNRRIQSQYKKAVLLLSFLVLPAGAHTSTTPHFNDHNNTLHIDFSFLMN